MPAGEINRESQSSHASLTESVLADPPVGGLTHSFRALRHRNYRYFIGGQIVSLIGTWMQTVAQSWLVYRLTHSELLLGTAIFCSQIAVFALGPLAGLAGRRPAPAA